MKRSEAAAVLGVPITATPDEVRAAYRTRTRLLHPDRFATAAAADHAAATTEQTRVNAARDVLLDPSHRDPGEPSPAATRSAAVHHAAADRLDARAAQLARWSYLVGLPSLALFVISLLSHGAFPGFLRGIVVISVVGSIGLAGRARSRHRLAEAQRAQAQQILQQPR